MNKELGRQGEDTAAAYLRKKGYSIIKRNYYTRYGEVDLICQQDKTLVFVEVKTRTGTRFGDPEEAISPRKIDHLRKAAFIFLESYHRAYRDIRFDVITIMVDRERETINHIEYAF